MPSIHWLASIDFLKLFKFEVVYVSVGPIGTKSHWVNVSQLLYEWSKYFQQKLSLFFVYVLIFFQLWIKECDQLAHRPIGSIPLICFVLRLKNVGNIFMSVKYFLIVGQIGTKAHSIRLIPCKFSIRIVLMFLENIYVKTFLQ